MRAISLLWEILNIKLRKKKVNHNDHRYPPSICHDNNNFLHFFFSFIVFFSSSVMLGFYTTHQGRGGRRENVSTFFFQFCSTLDLLFRLLKKVYCSTTICYKGNYVLSITKYSCFEKINFLLNKYPCHNLFN